MSHFALGEPRCLPATNSGSTGVPAVESLRVVVRETVVEEETTG